MVFKVKQSSNVHLTMVVNELAITIKVNIIRLINVPQQKQVAEMRIMTDINTMNQKNLQSFGCK